jgi:hypothetical protein
VILTLAVDRPNAMLAVRLCDVSPIGSSALVSRGLLNLTHSTSHEHPIPLEPGEQYTVTVRLNGIAHSLPAGHRWRIAISPTYWPWAWPSPEPVTLSLFTGSGCQLFLPVRLPREEDSDLVQFAEPEGASPLKAAVLRPSTRTYSGQHDAVSNTFSLVDGRDGGHKRIEANGLEHASLNKNVYTIVAGDPLSAQVQCEQMMQVGRRNWQIRIKTDSTMTADLENFYVTNLLEAYEGNVRVFTKSWDLTVPRELV